MLTDIAGVEMKESPQWLKIVLPVRRSSSLLVLFTACLLVWVVMLAGVIAAIFREQYGFVLNVMLFVWLLLWLWLGRILWRRWQYYAANRELLFINEEQLIVRRPVSVLGSTDVYDFKHVSPLYYSEKHQCPAFDYAFQHVYFGQSLAADAASQLIDALNNRYFPDRDQDTG
jgi:hypothetical protein